MTAPGTSSFQRTLAILTALGSEEAARRGGLGVVEIARQVGKEKTQVSRALKALSQAGLVERDPDTLCYGWAGRSSPSRPTRATPACWPWHRLCCGA